MSNQDYRRGRSAIGALAGRRRMTLNRRRRSGFQLLAAAGAAIATVAVIAIIAVGWLYGPAGGTSMPAANAVKQPLPAAVAGSSQERQIIPAIETRYRDWQAAQADVGFPIQQPSVLPAGYHLSALQGFAISAGQPPVDVIATYDGPGGATLVFDQAPITRPDLFDFEKSIRSPPADIARGRLTVNGAPAYWMHGVSTWTDSGEPLGWRSDLLVLSWLADGAPYRSEMRLDASDLSLEQLTSIAGSVR